MSDTPVDNAVESAPTSQPVAPPQGAGDPQGSTPASVDTTATPATPEADEAKRQTRRESRAFAAQRRENRELHERLGYLQAQLERLQPPAAPQTDNEQPQERQTRAAPPPANRAQADLNRSILERIEDAGESIEGFDEVVDKITANDFPISAVMRDYLGDSEKPADMAKWLADNPKEARRISLLSEVGAWKAMERAESKLAKPAPKTTKAPPPVPTVGGRSTPEFDPQKSSMDEYGDHWHKQRAG